MTELNETMRDAALVGESIAVTPSGSAVGIEVRPPVKPAGKWAMSINYDPEKGTREADFQTPVADYVKRYNVRETITPTTGGAVTPEFQGVFLEPVLDRRTFQRWKPVLIESVPHLKQFFQSESGRKKRFIEQFGIDPIMSDDPLTGGLSPTRLIDQGDFVPLMNGPFYKQLYIYDYLLMHSRAFQLVNHNALAAAAVKIMTRFTLGRGIGFTIKNDQARAVWEEFWERNKLKKKLRLLARDFTWQGELLMRYYEPREGFMTLRCMDASSCWEVVTDPEDVEQVYYYHFQYPCLRGETRIACLDGTNPTIADLADGYAQGGQPVWVYSYDHKMKRIVPGKATKIWKTGRKRCVEVEIDNGDKIVASYDHPFLLRDGRYVPAEELTPGASLMPLYRRRGYEEVWQPDARWEPTHHVVAEHVQGHLDNDRSHNQPENLAFMPKPVHDAETSARRWTNPEFAVQREAWVEGIKRAVKSGWKNGAYAHLTGKGARKDRKKWRRAIAKGVATSWKNPDIRSRRLQAMRGAKPTNHKVVAVRAAGVHVVYDIQVERYHNFALASGVFTHNTPYQVFVSGNIPVSKYIIQQVPPTNIQHVTQNISAQERRGRSDLLPGMSWLKRTDDFYNGQTVKALLEANLVWKVKVKGDQADVDAFLSNPAFTELPPPGGMWIENEAVNLEAQSATMTASRGSQGIGQQLANFFALSMNLPAEWFNLEGGPAPSRATALVRTDPAVKTIEDRQQLFREMVEEIYDRVMTSALLAGRISREAVRAEPVTGPGEDDEDNEDDDVRTVGSVPVALSLPLQRSRAVRLR